ALKVPLETLEAYGAVSEETVRAMAEGAQRLFSADSSIAVTGIAGPGGGTPEKPVGTVWLAARVHTTTRAIKRVLPGAGDVVRRARGVALSRDPAQRSDCRGRDRVAMVRAGVPAAPLEAAAGPGARRLVADAADSCPSRCRRDQSRPGGERGVRRGWGGAWLDDPRSLARDPVGPARRACRRTSHRNPPVVPVGR